MIIGSTVRDLRASKGISQQALADAIGVTFQQVQKYESGRNRIAAVRLLQIARALDVRAEVLLPSGSMTALTGDTGSGISTEVRELLKLFHQVDNPAQRRAVLQFLRRLANT